MDEFQLHPFEPQRPVVPLEPLYSMLHDAPIKALEYLHGELSTYESEKELDDIIPNLGITRKKALEQTMLVLTQRNQQISEQK